MLNSPSLCRNWVGDLFIGLEEFSSLMNEKLLFNSQEAAAYLSTPIKTLRRWARQRIVPSIKIGRKLLFRRVALDALLRRLETRSVADKGA
jgi:excisionase family DNA binding protein